jgi:ssDNA thymidine ADP-ribosyltransferase, DarT
MTAIYHITDINNLERIIRANGLFCDTQRLAQGFPCVGIAHQSLKERRARTIVPVAAEGKVADYVPFYFANRSPMLYSIHTGHVSGYDGGQKSIVYLVSSVERVSQGDRSWCFTDGHAVEAMTTFFDDLDSLVRVDWALIYNWSWKNTEEDPDRKRRKQAEFLIHESFPWNWVERIGVLNAAVAEQVQAILSATDARPEISVQPKSYY